MNNVSTSQNKKIITLAVLTVAVSVLFSFMGAPFLRALSAKAKPIVFWGVGFLIVAILFLVQLTLGSIYVGAVWTTLGLYSELEKRGVSWKITSLIALSTGALFAFVGYFVAVSSLLKINLAEQITGPILQTMKQLKPEDALTADQFIQYMPGALIAALICSLAVGFIFEAKVFQWFNLQREKTASGLKWLEFRLPDQFIWLSLVGFFLSLVKLDMFFANAQVITEKIRIIALNISIFSLVAFFLQGISVFEYLTRFYRVGAFNKVLIYFLIFVWLAPAIGFIGLIDYWADFRKMVRKKLK